MLLDVYKVTYGLYSSYLSPKVHKFKQEWFYIMPVFQLIKDLNLCFSHLCTSFRNITIKEKSSRLFTILTLGLVFF